MDTGKVLKVVNDIQHDESSLGLQETFQNILNLYIDQNPDGLNSAKADLRQKLNDSSLYNYVLTDVKILEHLKIENFFGEQSWKELNLILDSQAHEVAQKLKLFVLNRQESLNKLSNFKNSLDSFGVNPKDLSKGEYEIGFSFPENYQYLNKLPEVLVDIRNLLFAVASGSSVANKNFKIKSVSNGSIQFYIEAAKELAQNFDIVLDYTLKIYAFLQMIQELQSRYKEFHIKKQAEIEEINKEEIRDRKDDYLDKMLDELSVVGNEDRVRIKGLLNKFLKHIESGVSAEVRTPNIEAPRDSVAEDDDATRKKIAQSKKDYEFKQKIDTRNRNIFILQQNNFNGIDMALLDLPEIDD